MGRHADAISCLFLPTCNLKRHGSAGSHWLPTSTSVSTNTYRVQRPVRTNTATVIIRLKWYKVNNRLKLFVRVPIRGWEVNMDNRYVCYDEQWQYFVHHPRCMSRRNDIGSVWHDNDRALVNLKANGHSPVLYNALYVLLNPGMAWPKE